MTLLKPSPAFTSRVNGTMLPSINGYSRRQVIALEHPEERDPISWMSTNDPHKRKVTVVLNNLQLVSILTVDLDDQPVWHGRVGYMEAKDEFFTPITMWSEEMFERAWRELNRLTRLPRDIDKHMEGRRPKARPTNIHRFIPCTSLEKDYLEVVLAGGVKRQVKLRGPDGVWR